MSPDGRHLLAAGDSPKIYLHSISSQSSTPTKIGDIDTSTDPYPPHPSSQAIFSTSFSSDGRKFAVGSQNGVVQIWDIRSMKRRLEMFQTRQPLSKESSKEDGSVVNSTLYPDQECMGKVWGVRCLRFSNSGLNGRELLVFSEVGL